MYQQHQQWRAGRRNASPFMTWETYAQALHAFFMTWQGQPHERVTLGGQRVIPQEEFARLYTTRVVWSAESVALALLRSGTRVVRKNGVNCFQRDWFYWHAELSYWKGRTVEMRYTERDYQRVWIVLPDQQTVEAALVTPTPLLQPNQETLRQVARARQAERQLINDYQLLAASQVRGETTAARVAQERHEIGAGAADATKQQATLHPLPRLRVRSSVPARVDAVVGEGEELPPVAAVPRQGLPYVNEFEEEEKEDLGARQGLSVS